MKAAPLNGVAFFLFCEIALDLSYTYKSLVFSLGVHVKGIRAKSMNERRTAIRYAVNWSGRALLADRSIFQVSVKDISKGGAAILFYQALSTKTPLNIEILIPHQGGFRPLRAKTVVCHTTLLASGDALLGLLFVEMKSEDAHFLGNVLQKLGDQEG